MRSDEHLPRHSYCGQFGIQVASVVAPATSEAQLQSQIGLAVGLGAGGSAGTGTRRSEATGLYADRLALVAACSAPNGAQRAERQRR